MSGDSKQRRYVRRQSKREAFKAKCKAEAAAVVKKSLKVENVQEKAQ